MDKYVQDASLAASVTRTRERSRILNEASMAITGAREQDYGTPEDNLGTIARLWQAYLNGKPGFGFDITAQDVAHMMILLKVARLARNPLHRDSVIDAAGYAALAGEIAANTPQTEGPQRA